jgi:hypothetical protein
MYVRRTQKISHKELDIMSVLSIFTLHIIESYVD